MSLHGAACATAWAPITPAVMPTKVSDTPTTDMNRRPIVMRAIRRRRPFGWAPSAPTSSGALTRHRDHFAGQVTGVVTGQERDRGGHFPRFGGAAERLDLRQPVQQLGAAGLLQELVPCDAR